MPKAKAVKIGRAPKKIRRAWKAYKGSIGRTVRRGRIPRRSLRRRRYRLSRLRIREPLRLHRSPRWAGKWDFLVLLHRANERPEYAEMVSTMRTLLGSDFKVLRTPQRRRREEDRRPVKLLLRSDAALFLMRLSFPKLIYQIKRIANPAALADAENLPSGSDAEPADAL